MPSQRQQCELLLTIVQQYFLSLLQVFVKINSSYTAINEETHGKNSHQEIGSKCEQHDCISVKMLLKLNDQINSRKIICSIGCNECIRMEIRSGKLDVA